MTDFKKLLIWIDILKNKVFSLAVNFKRQNYILIISPKNLRSIQLLLLCKHRVTMCATVALDLKNKPKNNSVSFQLADAFALRSGYWLFSINVAAFTFDLIFSSCLSCCPQNDCSPFARYPSLLQV